MYHVPVNHSDRHNRRHHLALVGALQGARNGFLLALAFGAALGALGLVISMFFDPLGPDLGQKLLAMLFVLGLWMLGVALVGGIPAAIIGVLTGLAIGARLRRLGSCDDERAERIGHDVSTIGIVILHLIVVPVAWLAVHNDGNVVGMMLAVLVLIWLPCLIYTAAAGRFAIRLNQKYPA
jgi:uncharacterized membrane protein